MNRRVVVTGLGAVTSLGLKVPDIWARLLRGESGIRLLKLFDTEKFKVKFGGEITDWNPGEEYLSAKEVRRVDRFTQFAHVAGIDAVRESGLDFSKEDPFRCGVILGSGIGGLHEIEEQLARLLSKGPDRVSAFLVPKMMVNAASGYLVDSIRPEGPQHRRRHRLRQRRQRHGRRGPHHPTQ